MGWNTRFVVFLIGLSGAALAQAEEPLCEIHRIDGTDIRFGAHLGCREKQTLANDLARLHRFEPVDPSPETYSVLNSLDLTGPMLESWLAEHLQAIDLKVAGSENKEYVALVEARLLLSVKNAGAGDSIRRLGSLFHLSLHSNDADSGHRSCPAIHDYAGLSVCDANESAAYQTEGLILRELLKGCSDCSIEDRESLRLEIADRLLRADGGGR